MIKIKNWISSNTLGLVILALFSCASAAYLPYSFLADDENMVYCEVYAKNNATVTTIAAVDTYAQVVAGATSGVLNGCTHSTGTITVTEGGTYLVIVSSSANGGNNKVFHFSVSVEGTAQNNCHMPRKVSATDQGVWSVSCAIILSAGEDVALEVENVNDASDITVTDFDFLLLRVAG